MSAHTSHAAIVALDQLVRDPRAWPRRETDPERVSLFMSFYADGGTGILPPIELVETSDGTRLLSDGWNRLEAARRVGVAELPADIVPVPAGVEATEFAFRRALEHSTASAKPLSLGERRAAARRLLQADDELSLREIGRLTGLSHHTVGRVQDSMTGQVAQTEPRPDETYLAQTSAAELTDRLVQGVAKVWDARGFNDLVARRMPGTLANALIHRFGKADGRQWARRLERWAASAAAQLDDR